VLPQGHSSLPAEGSGRDFSQHTPYLAPISQFRGFPHENSPKTASKIWKVTPERLYLGHQQARDSGLIHAPFLRQNHESIS
jgi:hypothetical protein